MQKNATEREEPRHRNDSKGKYHLLNGKIIITNISFDTVKDAENWGRWNDFDRGQPYTIVPNYDHEKA